MTKTLVWKVTKVEVNNYGTATVTMQPRADEFGEERVVYHCSHDEAPAPFSEHKIVIHDDGG